MAKYKVGDRVVVRKDLSRRERYYMDDSPIIGNSVTPSMYELRGCVVTITGFDGQYFVAEDEWRWTDGMFEGLESDFEEELSPPPDIKALFD